MSTYIEPKEACTLLWPLDTLHNAVLGYALLFTLFLVCFEKQRDNESQLP